MFSETKYRQLIHYNSIYISLVKRLFTRILIIIMIFFSGRKSLGFATDPYANKLYYTELFELTVNMVRLETGMKTIIVKKTRYYVYDLVLDRNTR